MPMVVCFDMEVIAVVSNKVHVGILFLVLVTATGTSALAADLEVCLGTSGGELGSLGSHGLRSSASGDKGSCVDDVSPCPCVYGYAEGLFLQRSNDSFDQPVLVRATGPEATALSTSDLDFDFDPALRALVGRRLHNGWAIEGSYLGLFDATASAFIEASPQDPPRPLTFPGGLGPGTNLFADINRSWVNYSSELHSAELNLVSCRGCCGTGGDSKGDCGSKCDGGSDCVRCSTVEWFVGFRYLSLRERFNIYAEADREPTGGGPLITESGFYDVRTGNNLYGPQVGVRLRRWENRLGWEATGKAGIFGNDAQQQQSVVDYPNFQVRPELPTPAPAGAAGGQVAFVGELNFTGIYRLTDVWNLRAGYNLIWIAGVALAPDQLDFSDDPAAGNQLSSNGSVFLHGVSCGLEARW
jgi:hypothetical protein